MTQAEAIAFLKQEKLTLVLYNEAETEIFSERGVAPLLSLLDRDRSFSDFCAVDKVVGKAAAFLYIALGIKSLHAVTLSESALSLLREHCVTVTYETLVPRVLNRAGDGYCPMESSVLSESEVHSAIEKIRATRASLLENKKASHIGKHTK